MRYDPHEDRSATGRTVGPMILIGNGVYTADNCVLAYTEDGRAPGMEAHHRLVALACEHRWSDNYGYTASKRWCSKCGEIES